MRSAASPWLAKTKDTSGISAAKAVIIGISILDSAFSLAQPVLMGMLVTGAGPHAGDEVSARNGLNTLLMSRLHAIPVWLMTAGTIYGLVLARKEKIASATRAFTFLLIVEVAQGIIGYTQFFTGLPVPVVMAHIAGLCLVITAAVFVVDSVYTRDPLPASVAKSPATTSA